MHALATLRLSRIVTFVLLTLFLAGCGKGEGQPRIFNSPVQPEPPIPEGFCDPINFEPQCPQPTFFEFEGGVVDTVDVEDLPAVIAAGNDSITAGRMRKVTPDSGLTFGGNIITPAIPFEVTLGSSFTMQVYSTRDTTVRIEPDVENAANFGVDVIHGGTGWEELTFELPTLTGTVPGIVLFFDVGILGEAQDDPEECSAITPCNWTFFFDDITLVSPGGPGPGPGPSVLPVDFEADPASYDFGMDGGFGGGASDVIANPDPSGLNTTAQTARMQKFAGEIFGGSTLALGGNVDFAAGEVFTMKVWATRQVPVLFKFEGLNKERTVNHGGSGGWEELCFDFSADTAGAASNAITFIFENGVAGDAANDPNNWTFYFDEIEQVADCSGGTGPSVLPVDFEADPASYDFGMDGGFGGGAADVIANPDPSGLNTTAQTARMQKFAGEIFGGSTLALGGNVDFAAGEVFTMKVWATRQVPVLFKFEGLNKERTVNHGGSGGWEELCFDFSADTAGAASNAITFIFENGVAGDAANDPNNWTFYFDEIEQVASCPPTGGGGSGAAVDFETAGTGAGFTWNVFENGDNPPLEIIPNPDATGANTSATVAKFTARQAGQPFAGTVTSDLPTFTLDASNAIVKILVWKPEISDVGIKFETASGASSGEIKVANTVVNGWEELTFDFSGKIGEPSSTDVTGLVVFPDFNARGQDNVVYFDNINFAGNSGGGDPGGGMSSVDFESGSATFNDFGGAVAAVVPNPDASGINTSSQVGQMQKFAGEIFAGSTLDLGGPVALADGDSYTMKVRAQREVVVTLKLETLGEERTATHSGSGTWEALCFDFTGVATDLTGLTIIFDNGTAGDAAGDPDAWTFQFDDIQQTSDACPSGGGTATTVDFEDAGGPYTFSDFGGGTGTVIDNPDAAGINTSAKVARMEKFAGEVFGGSTLTLPAAIDFSAGEVFTMKVRAQRVVPVLFKLEGLLAERSLDTSGSGTWEEMCFDFTGSTAGPASSAITFIFDLGVNGDAGGDPTNWTFEFDDIQQAASCPSGGGTATTVDFEDAGGPYTFSDFGGGTGTVIDNPDAAGINTSAKVARMEKFAGEVFGGSTLTLPAAIDFSAGEVFTMKVRAQRVVPVLFKLEGLLAERSLDTSGSGTWEEMCFDFTGSTAGPASSAITFIFDLGVNGDAGGDPTNWTFEFDDIQQAASCPGGGSGACGGNAPVDFEPAGNGGTCTWTVFENDDNPPLEIVANPAPDAVNGSATVAKYTARVTGQPFAGVETAHGDIGPLTLDASNSIIKVLVWKPVISDVGVKFAIANGGAQPEIKVSNTVVDQWEELSFDLSGYIGLTEAIDIDQLIIFPDFDLGGRAQENVVYFDDVRYTDGT